MKYTKLTLLSTLFIALASFVSRTEAGLKGITVPDVIESGKQFNLGFVVAPDAGGSSSEELFFAVVGISERPGAPSTLYNILERVNLSKEGLSRSQANFSLPIRAIDVPSALSKKPVPVLIRVGVFHVTGDDRVFGTLDLTAETMLKPRGA